MLIVSHSRCMKETNRKGLKLWKEELWFWWNTNRIDGFRRSLKASQGVGVIECCDAINVAPSSKLFSKRENRVKTVLNQIGNGLIFDHFEGRWWNGNGDAGPREKGKRIAHPVGALFNCELICYLLHFHLDDDSIIIFFYSFFVVVDSSCSNPLHPTLEIKAEV